MKITAFLPSSFTLSSGSLNTVPSISLPDSSIMKNGNPFFIPDFDTSFSATIYTAVKICRLGKTISPRFTARYYTSFAPALNLRADNLLRQLSENGLPWNAACGFDKSLVLGEFVETGSPDAEKEPCILMDGKKIHYLWPDKDRIAEAIKEASQYNALKMGDLILIPVENIEAIPLSIGHDIKIDIGDKTLLSLPIK